jgi:phytoene dehydrogenase-like protein
MLAHMDKYISNVGPQNIVAYHCDSPLDMERTSPSFMHGDLHGVASTTYQYGAHRPTPDLGMNVVPGCERLYLVGPFQHPGGGVFGAGRAAAMRMCEDLKIDFDKIGVRR